MNYLLKLLIAVVAGYLAFKLMTKMTKWIFRIVVAVLVIAIVFYGATNLDDVKEMFAKAPAVNETMELPANEPVASGNVSEQNISETSLPAGGPSPA